jgi:hypothetical protein
LKEAELARQLRLRHIEKGLTPREVLASIPDRAMVLSYIQCAQCHEYEIDLKDLDACISEAKSAEDFFTVVESLTGPSPRVRPTVTRAKMLAGQLHQHGRHN